MALIITNFKAVGLNTATNVIHVDDEGLIVSDPADGADHFDCGGAFLSPGWCDLHVHVWHGGTDISVRPSQAGRESGVTSMADAGSAGEANFHGLREYVIDPSAETIRAFLNIGSIGLVACNRVSELGGANSIDIDRVLATIDANRDVICGVKVRASGVITGTWGITPAKIAKRVAEIANLPLMAHVGEPAPLVDEVLALLGPGDIVTHCFNGKRGGAITDTAALFLLARQMSESGVVMDIGHGTASFSFETARQAIAEGFMPDTISTDLHLRNIDGPVYDLALTASKLMALGMNFDDCLAAITRRPRAVLGLQGVPAEASRADFTVFELEDSGETVMDSQGQTMQLERVFVPRHTIIGPTVHNAARRRP